VACIPNKLIINKKSILASEIGFLIEKNPKIFNEKVYSSNEFNYFVVFLIYEKLKGKKSFWYEYIDIIQEDAETMITWQEKDLLETEDIHLIGEVLLIIN
jgi:hypothetical protein